VLLGEGGEPDEVDEECGGEPTGLALLWLRIVSRWGRVVQAGAAAVAEVGVGSVLVAA
jgi:hypothetical protein